MNSPAADAWTPERAITAARATSVIREHFPEFAHAHAEFFGEGWDNTVVRLRPRRRAGPAAPGDAADPNADEADVIFRFPRRKIALAGVRRELEWLGRLAPLLPLPIPAPRWHGSWTPEDHVQDSWPFWGGRFVPGTELAASGIPDERRDAVAGQLGTFLRVLHSLRPQAFVAAGVSPLPHDPLGRADPRRRSAMTAASLTQLSADMHLRVDGALRLLDEAETLRPPTGNGVVCHGDLHARHVLVAHGPDAPTLPVATGIIDWGDMCQGDPAIDLSIAYGAFRGHARRTLLESYGTVDAARELRARALALSLNSLLAAYALAGPPGTGATLLAEAVNGIRRALDD